MSGRYPHGIAGNPAAEYIFDLGFTHAFSSLADIWEGVKQESPHAPGIVERFNALFAAGQVKLDGGNRADQAMAARIYGDYALAENLEKSD